MKDKEIIALINLLEDPDLRVHEAVSEKIKQKGTGVIPSLERAWETSLDQSLQQKIEELIQEIQFDHVKTEIKNWIQSGGEDLLFGAFLVAKYQYPDLYFSEVEQHVESLRKEIWLELHDNLTALEKVRVINHILFAINKFSRNTANFYSPRNSYINQVLETKKGNPISLSIVYASVAQKLGLPVHGINLPLNYILAYTDPYFENEGTGVLFYINPYNRGNVLSKKDIDSFLRQQKLEPREEYYKPCSNITTIERVIRNLLFSYEKLGYVDKTREIGALLKLIQKEQDQ
ncbi:MAG: transglutaminase-like domain-containing protein [Bacteroidota bacterium]